MSADNVIYVTKTGGRKKAGGHYYVWMTFMSDPRGPHLGDITEATTLEEAFDIANCMAEEIGIVEYGIQCY